MMQMLDTREALPIIRFVKTAEEDKVASEMTGRLQYKDVTKVYIRAPGDMKNEHVDVAETVAYDVTTAEVKVEEEVTTYKEVDGELKEVTEKAIIPRQKNHYKKKIANPWIEKLKYRLHHKKISQAYFDHCKSAFDRFKEGQDQPINGTPLYMWAGANEAVKKRAIECGILSVESAAEMTEEAIQAIGMGARDLKKLAQAFVSANREPEENARKMIQMQESNETMKEQLSALEQKLAELSEDKPRRGRPRKEEAA